MKMVGFLRSYAAVLIAVAALWAIAYLPNLGARPMRLEEGRRGTPAREMLQTGNFALPTLYGEPYLNKPPMFFWVVAACGWAQGEVNALSTRMPSVLALLAGAVLITRFARRDLPRETRNLSALLLIATVVMVDKAPLGEIESFLAFLLLAAMVCWWWGYRDAGARWGAWALAGLMLGGAMLIKGPPAIVEFYLPLVVFLVWQRRLKLLIAPAHLVCVLLMILPGALWVWSLYAGNPAGFGNTIHVWLGQMAVDRVVHPIDAAPDDVRYRYLIFPLETIATFSPWIFFAIPAFVPRWARQLGIPDDLRRFLVATVIVTFLFFWAWPNGRPRHFMAACYPIVTLAAVCIMAGWRRKEAILRAWLPAALGITVAIAIGRCVYAVAIVPKFAAKDPTQHSRLEIEAAGLPAEAACPRYTTFSFASLEGEGVYNAQFYFGERLRAVAFVGGHPDFSTLPAGPLVLFVSPEEMGGLSAAGRWTIKPLLEFTVHPPGTREVPVRAVELTPAIKK